MSVCENKNNEREKETSIVTEMKKNNFSILTTICTSGSLLESNYSKRSDLLKNHKNEEDFKMLIQKLVTDNENLLEQLKLEIELLKSNYIDDSIPLEKKENLKSTHINYPTLIEKKDKLPETIIYIGKKEKVETKKDRKCSCITGGCIKGYNTCKCIECNENCACGDRCKKTTNLQKKVTVPKHKINSIKKEETKNIPKNVDDLYIFLDTEGGKTNKLHDLYAVLKFGTTENNVVYFGCKETFSTHTDFDMFNDFLQHLKNKYNSTRINLLAWNMDKHDKGILKQFVTIKNVYYHDLLVWYRTIMDANSYKLQQIAMCHKLTIHGNIHTAECDTIVMVNCFCLAIAQYFDQCLNESYKERLLNAYNKNDEETINKLEKECFEFIKVEISFENYKELRSRTITVEKMVSILDYLLQ